MAEKYKPCEVYRRMCDVYVEACFYKKKSGLNIGLPQQTQVENTLTLQ